jgi:hypothetical protein
MAGMGRSREEDRWRTLARITAKGCSSSEIWEGRRSVMTGIKERKKKFTYAPKKKVGNRPTLEYCIEHADDLAQRLVNKWGASGGDTAPLPADFKALLELACRYRAAKQNADAFRAYQTIRPNADPDRDLDALLEQEAAKELAGREVFAKACKDFQDKHEGGPAAGK